MLAKGPRTVLRHAIPLLLLVIWKAKERTCAWDFSCAHTRGCPSLPSFRSLRYFSLSLAPSHSLPFPSYIFSNHIGQLPPALFISHPSLASVPALSFTTYINSSTCHRMEGTSTLGRFLKLFGFPTKHSFCLPIREYSLGELVVMSQYFHAEIGVPMSVSHHATEQNTAESCSSLTAYRHRGSAATAAAIHLEAVCFSCDHLAGYRP